MEKENRNMNNRTYVLGLESLSLYENSEEKKVTPSLLSFLSSCNSTTLDEKDVIKILKDKELGIMDSEIIPSIPTRVRLCEISFFI